MATNINILPNGFSGFHITNNITGHTYDFQVSPWQALLDIFLKLIGKETSLQKLTRICTDIYGKDSEKAFTAVFELIGCVKSRYQNDFSITFSPENTSEKNMVIYFNNNQIIKLPSTPFGNETSLYPYIKNKNEYKSYLLSNFSHFLTNDLLSALDALTPTEPLSNITAPSNTCDWPDNSVKEKNLYMDEILKCHVNIQSLQLIISKLIISRRDEQDYEILGIIKASLTIIKSYLSKITGNVYSNAINGMMIVHDPICYSEGHHHFPSDNLSSKLNTFHSLKNISDEIHEIIVNIRNDILNTDVQPGDKEYSFSAEITKFSRLMLQTLLPKMSQIKQLEETEGMLVLFDSQSMNPQNLDELQNSIDDVWINEMVDFLLIYRELCKNYYFPKNIIEDNDNCINIISKSKSKHSQISYEYNSQDIIFDSITRIYTNVYSYLFSELFNSLERLNKNHSAIPIAQEKTQLSELLTAFDFLVQPDGSYNFTIWDRFCNTQGVPLKDIESFHDIILTASDKVKQFK